eukprot:3354997-Pyramimonas_sp.AAC.1
MRSHPRQFPSASEAPRVECQKRRCSASRTSRPPAPPQLHLLGHPILPSTPGEPPKLGTLP